MDLSPLRSDRGLTRLESTVLMSILIVGLVVGASILIRAYSAAMNESALTTAQEAPALAVPGPVSVAVPAAGTIAQAPPATKKSRKDTCPDLRGVQPAGFDCTLPLYVPALDLSAVRVKAPYQCADPENYRLVRGQTVQRDKQCVLKTAKAGRS